MKLEKGNWFYSYMGKYYGNKLTSINDKISNKQIIQNENNNNRKARI